MSYLSAKWNAYFSSLFLHFSLYEWRPIFPFYSILFGTYLLEKKKENNYN
ncbi:unnamed protein product [Meloidogyne enterolobii]|uniref:Uncharacterized protein n=1 Tax=Meloidogyne enterolobii TaxID=390850 RepID=A0ACB0XUK2_MELEN